jgi:hypothetical protein
MDEKLRAGLLGCLLLNADERHSLQHVRCRGGTEKFEFWWAELVWARVYVQPPSHGRTVAQADTEFTPNRIC